MTRSDLPPEARTPYHVFHLNFLQAQSLHPSSVNQLTNDPTADCPPMRCPIQTPVAGLPASNPSKSSKSPVASQERFRFDSETGSKTPHSLSCLIAW